MDKDFMGVFEILKDEHGFGEGQEMVETTFLPSMQDFNRLRKWICWGDGLDPDGRWIGFCPLHDKSRRTEASATYDFVKGMFWCNGEERCTPGRAMSLSNLYLAVATRVLA